MLSEYIDNYVKALKNKDKKAQAKIEKDLAKLGMDKMTLMILVAEQVKGGLK